MGHGFHGYVSHNQRVAIKLSGWWLPNYLEKYESQWEGLSRILWKIKNVPNHQPDILTLTINRQSMDWFNIHILGNQTAFF